jgi:hypothetical protein
MLDLDRIRYVHCVLNGQVNKNLLDILAPSRLNWSRACAKQLIGQKEHLYIKGIVSLDFDGIFMILSYTFYLV